jgi:hypothetical protein
MRRILNPASHFVGRNKALDRMQALRFEAVTAFPLVVEARSPEIAAVND